MSRSALPINKTPYSTVITLVENNGHMPMEPMPRKRETAYDGYEKTIKYLADLNEVKAALSNKPSNANLAYDYPEELNTVQNESKPTAYDRFEKQLYRMVQNFHIKTELAKGMLPGIRFIRD